eukprot:5694632-Amphidinium_carterae.1
MEAFLHSSTPPHTQVVEPLTREALSKAVSADSAVSRFTQHSVSDIWNTSPRSLRLASGKKQLII